jgi:hypothetical protein
MLGKVRKTSGLTDVIGVFIEEVPDSSICDLKLATRF